MSSNEIKFFSIEETNALFSLAERESRRRGELMPSATSKLIFKNYWYGICKKNNTSHLKCRICDEYTTLYAVDLIEHGRQHLKEYNLLVFI